MDTATNPEGTDMDTIGSDTVTHAQVKHQTTACGAPFDWRHVTVRFENVTCPDCVIQTSDHR